MKIIDRSSNSVRVLRSNRVMNSGMPFVEKNKIAVDFWVSKFKEIGVTGLIEEKLPQGSYTQVLGLTPKSICTNPRLTNPMVSHGMLPPKFHTELVDKFGQYDRFILVPIKDKLIKVILPVWIKRDSNRAFAKGIDLNNLRFYNFGDFKYSNNAEFEKEFFARQEDVFSGKFTANQLSLDDFKELTLSFEDFCKLSGYPYKED